MILATGAPEKYKAAFTGREIQAGWGSASCFEAPFHLSSHLLRTLCHILPKMPLTGLMRLPTANAGKSLSSVLTQFPQNAKLATGSNPTLPKTHRKWHVKLSGASRQPGWTAGFLTPGRQGTPSAADSPERLPPAVGPPAPAAPYPWRVRRGATAARVAPKTPQVEGDGVPAIPPRPSSAVPTTPGSRPHGTGLAPALE